MEAHFCREVSMAQEKGVKNRGKALHLLGLHEDRNVHPGVDVMRVPGGWIYLFIRPDGEGCVTDAGIFIPYDEEFKEA
jgi:hypothetical protein